MDTGSSAVACPIHPVSSGDGRHCLGKGTVETFIPEQGEIHRGRDEGGGQGDPQGPAVTCDDTGGAEGSALAQTFYIGDPGDCWCESEVDISFDLFADLADGQGVAEGQGRGCEESLAADEGRGAAAALEEAGGDRRFRARG